MCQAEILLPSGVCPRSPAAAIGGNTSSSMLTTSWQCVTATLLYASNCEVYPSAKHCGPVALMAGCFILEVRGVCRRSPYRQHAVTWRMSLLHSALFATSWRSFIPLSVLQFETQPLSRNLRSLSVPSRFNSCSDHSLLSQTDLAICLMHGICHPRNRRGFLELRSLTLGAACTA